jgi:hypothetical protein
MTSFRSSRRVAAVLSVSALAVTAVPAAPAQAGLLSPLAGLLTSTGQTLGGLLPGVGGVVTTVTGTVGGVVAGVDTTLTGVVDNTLNGVTGLLPATTLTSLLGGLLPPAGGPGAAGGVGGPIVLSGGAVGPGGVIVDTSAPRPTVTVLSKLRTVARTGTLRLQISTDEPGIVALKGNVRPGAVVNAKKRTAHSRQLIRVPSVVLGYRRAGKLTVTVKLSRAAQRTLGRSRDARMSVGTVTADLFRNQAVDSTRLKLRR